MEFLISFFTDYGYWAVLFVLIICGFGVPIPPASISPNAGLHAGRKPEEERNEAESFPLYFLFNVFSFYFKV